MEDIFRIPLSTLLRTNKAKANFSCKQPKLPLSSPFIITGMTDDLPADYWTLANITTNHIPDKTTNCVRVFEPALPFVPPGPRSSDPPPPPSKPKLVDTIPDLTFKSFKSSISSGKAASQDMYWAFSPPDQAFTSSILKIVPSISKVEDHLKLLSPIHHSKKATASDVSLQSEHKIKDGDQLTAWLSAGPHVEPLHYDTSPNLHVVLRGSKHWVIFEPSSILKPRSRGGIQFHGVLDLLRGIGESPNDEVGVDPAMSKLDPNFDVATIGLNVYLEEGEALYLPACWAHEVRTVLPDKVEGEDVADPPFVFSVNTFYSKSPMVMNFEGMMASYLSYRLTLYIWIKEKFKGLEL